MPAKMPNGPRSRLSRQDSAGSKKGSVGIRQTPYTLSISHGFLCPSESLMASIAAKYRQSCAFCGDFVTDLTFYVGEVVWWCQRAFFDLQICFTLNFARFSSSG